MFKDDDKHETCYCENCLRLQQALDNIKDICNTYQMEYIVNNGVKLLTTKILQIIEGKENE